MSTWKYWLAGGLLLVASGLAMSPAVPWWAAYPLSAGLLLAASEQFRLARRLAGADRFVA